MRSSLHKALRVFLLSGLSASGLHAKPFTVEQIEFFESRIRPVLAQDCYECHSAAGKRKGGLLLDSRPGWQEGGDSGAAIVPGDAKASLLMVAIEHRNPDLEMPKAGAKLEDAIIADFSRWIEMGAPDPRDGPPSPEAVARDKDWDAVMERRKKWWSFQPIADPAVPGGEAANPVDRFLEAKLKGEGIPAGEAGKRTQIRRARFVLTGLPPTAEEIDAFLADSDPDAYGKLVDRLLGAPQFGEKWARHWMDWMRYAESHGSEGDPRIPHATQYRDYMIRALNADVPYDQLVREHIAGDLLENPRVNAELALNESAIGPAHYRFVFHGFAPTDALDEQVRFTDDQIDVVTKAFLGITVSCARCHDHKFDAISQKDFYALYGIFASCRPALVNVDAPGRLTRDVAAMRELKDGIRQELGLVWEATAESFAERLMRPDEAMKKAVGAAVDPADPLHAWHVLRDKEGEAFAKAYEKLSRDYAESKERLVRRKARHWFRLGSSEDFGKWARRGSGTSGEPVISGDVAIELSGDRLIRDILPAGAYTHRFSTKHNGVFESPRMKLDGHYKIHARVAGDGKALLRYVVQNYPRSGTVYPTTRINGGQWRWQSWDLKYWDGDMIHLEAATAGDSPILVDGSRRSWIGLRDVLLVKASDPAPKNEIAEQWNFLEFEGPAGSAGELAGNYAAHLRLAASRWGVATEGGFDRDALFLGHLLRAGLLTNSARKQPEAARLVEQYRKLEAAIPDPIRAPGVAEGDTFDQPLFVRGDHRQPADAVPRRFLDAFGARKYETRQSGRRELAEDIVGNNTLAGRVIANRLWHHVFGRGIVATTDNFGRLGEKPSHPELLDYLATRMKNDGWSLKRMIRLLVTSDAFRRESGAVASDPDNVRLAHFPIRRLEAEAVRDALLAVSGRLDSQMYGGAANGDSGRRSVYVNVIRNRLDPFLSVFNAPEPLSTRGRRDVTNVPAQALAMMNSGFVNSAASQWAGRIRNEGATESGKVERMFVEALGRLPSGKETEECLRFLEGSDRFSKEANGERTKAEAALRTSEERMEAIAGPVREQLLAEKRKNRGASRDDATVLKPFAAWEFDDDLKDSVGNLHARAHRGAKLEDGALVLNGGYAVTSPVGKELREKTLEVWVQLDTLDQKGGGAITVQTPRGNLFDSIVFAERNARHWMAGSNHFDRTEDFSGAEPEGETKRPVHLAIAYAADGTITGYREGQPYGKPYKKSVLAFEAGKANVAFGVRHMPASGNRLLRARIHRARLYDRALTPEEVRASATGKFDYVREEELLAALSESERNEYLMLQRRLPELKSAVAKWNSGASRNADPWTELAHSIFNLKEFIYLR